MKKVERMAGRVKDFFVRHPFSVIVIAILVLCILMGEVLLRAEELPDAPAPAWSSSTNPGAPSMVLRAPAKASPKGWHRWLTNENVSYGVLAAGNVLDQWSTHDMLTHRHWVCGYNPAFLGGSFSVDGYLPSNLNTIPQMIAFCGPGPDGRQANYAVDLGQEFQALEETGWIVKFGIVGDRNTWGVIGGNLALDALQVAIPKVFHFKGRLRKIAIDGNYAHGIARMYAAMGNWRMIHRYGDPDRAFRSHPNIDQTYAVAAGRWWGTQ